MYFLIDYENVNNSGMQGCDYLLPEDTVEIFYGTSSPNISNRVFDAIEHSGCTLKICKLQSARKNALDFYISSRLGELIGKGYEGILAIISHDKDFKSVQEYWRVCAENHRRVIVSNTITDSIVSANENKPRTQMARETRKQVSLEKEFEKHEQRIRIRKILESQFSDTRFIDFMDSIERIFNQRSDMKAMYLSSLKGFGRADGTAIYNLLKELIIHNPELNS